MSWLKRVRENPSPRNKPDTLVPLIFIHYLSFAPTSRAKNARDMGHPLFMP
jgi:hypothetical protein